MALGSFDLLEVLTKQSWLFSAPLTTTTGDKTTLVGIYSGNFNPEESDAPRKSLFSEALLFISVIGSADRTGG